VAPCASPLAELSCLRSHLLPPSLATRWDAPPRLHWYARHSGDPATACSRRCEFSTYGLVVPALDNFGGYVVASGVWTGNARHCYSATRVATDLRTVLSIGRPSMYDGHCVREGGADAELTRNPDGSPLALDECLGDVEAESGPLDLGFDPRLDS
jgi:hypothetical protein